MIYINRIDPAIANRDNRDAVETRYAFYRVVSNDPVYHVPCISEDMPGPHILSAVYDGRNILYLMMLREDEEHTAGIDPQESLWAFLSAADSSFGVPVPCSVHNLSERVFVQLLVNALANYESDPYRFTNLTPGLFILPRSKSGRYGGLAKAVEFRVVEDRDMGGLVLGMDVRTFTRLDYLHFRKKADGRAKKEDVNPAYLSKARYVVKERYMIRDLSPRRDNRRHYVRHRADDSRTICFLALPSLKGTGSWPDSKMGILHELMAEFDSRYGGIGLSLRLESALPGECVIPTGKQFENDSLFYRTVIQYPVRIISTDAEEIPLAEQLRDTIAVVWNDSLPVEVSRQSDEEPTTGGLYLRLVHNKEFYEKNDLPDPYRIYPDVAVQHLTYEQLQESLMEMNKKINASKKPDPEPKNATVLTCLLNLAIKRDIISAGHSTLYDWSGSCGRHLQFYLKTKDDNDLTHYWGMDILEDGTFAFAELTDDPTASENISYRLDADVLDALFDADAECAIRDGSDINIIRKTPYFTVPDLDALQNFADTQHRQGDGIRAVHHREKYLDACIDIRTVHIGEGLFYYVGTAGSALKASIDRAADIRRIVPFEDSRIFLDELLDLMCVEFVRTGRLTVLPFPVKYLREYARMHS